MSQHRRVIRPDRIRRLEKPFGWIPLRLVTSGLLARLQPDEKLLYFFLATVADKNGVSFYGDQRIERELGISADRLAEARRRLMRRDLIAVSGRTVQILSMPPPDLASLLLQTPMRQRQRRGQFRSIGSVLDQLLPAPGHNSRQSE